MINKEEYDKSIVQLKQVQSSFKNAPKTTKKLAKPLLYQAVFQGKMLGEFMEKLQQPEDWVTTYQNGRCQSGETPSVYAKEYAQIMKTFNSTIKTLNEILPPDTLEQKDEFEKWTAG